MMLGIAMFTIVVSSRIMKKPRQSTSRASQGLRPTILAAFASWRSWRESAIWLLHIRSSTRWGPSGIPAPHSRAGLPLKPIMLRVERRLVDGRAFFGGHGVFPAERELGARFSVDVELEGDLRVPGASDRLEDTIDYARAYDVVREVVEGEPCHLLEA